MKQVYSLKKNSEIDITGRFRAFYLQNEQNNEKYNTLINFNNIVNSIIRTLINRKIMFTVFLFSYIAVPSSLTVSCYELSAHVPDSHYYFSSTVLAFFLIWFIRSESKCKTTSS